MLLNLWALMICAAHVLMEIFQLMKRFGDEF